MLVILLCACAGLQAHQRDSKLVPYGTLTSNICLDYLLRSLMSVPRSTSCSRVVWKSPRSDVTHTYLSAGKELKAFYLGSGVDARRVYYAIRAPTERDSKLPRHGAATTRRRRRRQRRRRRRLLTWRTSRNFLASSPPEETFNHTNICRRSAKIPYCCKLVGARNFHPSLS